jgi:hypothetical protein
MNKFTITKLDKGVVLKQRALESGQHRINIVIPTEWACVVDLFGYDLKPRFEAGGSRVVLRHTVSDVDDFVSWIMNNFIRSVSREEV